MSLLLAEARVSKCLINKLDSVQRLAVRMVTKQRYASSTHILSTHPLNLYPLQEQRWKQKTIGCARILRACFIVPPSHFTLHPHPSLSQRLHHSFQLVTLFARILAHQSSFFISSTLIYLNISFVPHLFLCLKIDLSLFQFLSLSLSFIQCFYFSSSDFFCFSGRLCISFELLLPDSVLH